MSSLPPEMIVLLAPFAQLFSEWVWQHAQILVVGALLAPGKRTVSNCLRVMGLALERPFTTYHRVLAKADAAGYPETRKLVERYEHYQTSMGTQLAGMEGVPPEVRRLAKTEPRGELTSEQHRLAKTTGTDPLSTLTPEQRRTVAEAQALPAPDLTEAIRMTKESQKIQIAFAPMTIIVRSDRGDVLGTTTAQPEIKPTGDYSAPTTSPTAVVR
jgi:hypothetical protein